MADLRINDDDFEPVPILMGRGTRARLLRLAQICGEPPTVIAAKLLHDILLEDDLAHVEEACQQSTHLN